MLYVCALSINILCCLKTDSAENPKTRYIMHIKALKNIVLTDCPYSSILTCKSQQTVTRRERLRVKSNELNSSVKQFNTFHFSLPVLSLTLSIESLERTVHRSL